MLSTAVFVAIVAEFCLSICSMYKRPVFRFHCHWHCWHFHLTIYVGQAKRVGGKWLKWNGIVKMANKQIEIQHRTDNTEFANTNVIQYWEFVVVKY